ncbi:MAG: 2-dehydro-3-deoxyphosphogluconate aldolase [Verrucomicrobia bacterium]|nr:MAG: 2-dehydro-3-deoxyphosphogluconate aldolase [Verrucomicrobiota bacterium]
MPTKSEIISTLANPGVIAIIRATSSVPPGPVCEALISGGVTAMEITLTTPNALAAIRTARDQIAGRAVLGAGSVLNAESCRAAIAAGAQFIVTPICRTECVAVAHAANCPIMLGAYTATEAQTAHEAGADFIKIFPAETLGPAYLKALLAPLPHLRLVPTGGVGKNNVAEFFKAGCAAVGVGSALVSSKILQEANWAELTHKTRELVEAAHRSS